MTVLVLATGSALAQDAPPAPIEDLNAVRTGVQACRDKLADDARLACFDDLGGKILGIQPPKADVAGTGKWQVSTDTDALTGTPTIVLGLPSSNKAPNSIGRSDEALLLTTCRKGRTDLFVQWPSYLGSTEQIAVRYRLDDGAIERDSWAPATSGRAAGLWSDGIAIPLIKRLLEAKKFTVAMTGRSTAEASVVFDLTGLPEAIKPLRAACKW
ncbi:MULTISPECIES: type VI secretion system-associated protein TagO [unclassified Inquilinus]|uniref:type VI secretion system-associated protein TagO n=1 Tax=unclassified Inquilinus TaxID=2645927 RepID=UPI003F8F1D70